MKRTILLIGGIIVLALGAGYFLSYDKTPATTNQKAGTGKCNPKPPLSHLDTSEPHLKALAAHQKACGSFATSTMMFFIGFPANKSGAEHSATEVAKRLKQFKKSGVTPIVIAEPAVDGTMVSYRSYLEGSYDTFLERFFTRLKALGVTSEMMGTWVPFPEPNTPLWNNKNTTPKDFARCVNKYLGEMKRHFPQAKGSVLLNSITYAPTDTGWQRGEYASLVPYVASLDPQLVTSFGIQGFPWAEHAKVARPKDANEFLQPQLAIEAADTLKTDDIWINTGTFGSRRPAGQTAPTRHTPEERDEALQSVLHVAKTIRQKGFGISVNLFSEDKTDTSEATDWSYINDPGSTHVLRAFFAAAHEENVAVSLFDRAK